MWSAEEEKAAAKPAAPQKKAPVKNKAIDSINQATEKSTLGDIDALSALRERMSGGEPKAE
jgi:small subunit ribosomal protein S1